MYRCVLYIALILAGCNGVGQTGPRGLIGRLVNSDGEPLKNVRIESEEQSVVTASDGTFEVRWKEPATFVFFEFGGLKYKRTWLPGVDQGVVDLRLPPSEKSVVSCQPERGCTAELVWEYPGGLHAEARVLCAPSAPQIMLEKAPIDEPLLVCRDLQGSVPVRLERSGGLFRIVSPEPAVKVLVRERDDCSVQVLHGTVNDNGSIRVERPTWAWTVCDDRVGPPLAVTITTKSLVLMPHDGGVDLAAHGHSKLYLLRLSPDGSAEWQIEVHAVDDVFHMPKLPRGEYRSVLGGLALLGRMNPPEPEIPGTMVFHRLKDHGYLGILKLEEDMSSGRLRVDGL